MSPTQKGTFATKTTLFPTFSVGKNKKKRKKKNTLERAPRCKRRRAMLKSSENDLEVALTRAFYYVTVSTVTTRKNMNSKQTRSSPFCGRSLRGRQVFPLRGCCVFAVSRRRHAEPRFVIKCREFFFGASRNFTIFLLVNFCPDGNGLVSQMN